MFGLLFGVYKRRDWSLYTRFRLKIVRNSCVRSSIALHAVFTALQRADVTVMLRSAAFRISQPASSKRAQQMEMLRVSSGRTDSTAAEERRDSSSARTSTHGIAVQRFSTGANRHPLMCSNVRVITFFSFRRNFRGPVCG